MTLTTPPRQKDPAKVAAGRLGGTAKHHIEARRIVRLDKLPPAVADAVRALVAAAKTDKAASS